MSLLEIIEQINVLGPLPDPTAKAAMPIQFEVASLWSRAQPGDAEEARGRIRLIGPNNTEALSQEFVVNLTENARMRTQLRSLGFPLLGTGRYMFFVDIERAPETWETVARIPVQVDSIAQPPVVSA